MVVSWAGRHDPRAASIRHVDDGPHDHRGIYEYCETCLYGSDPKGATEMGNSRFLKHQ